MFTIRVIRKSLSCPWGANQALRWVNKRTLAMTCHQTHQAHVPCKKPTPIIITPRLCSYNHSNDLVIANMITYCVTAKPQDHSQTSSQHTQKRHSLSPDAKWPKQPTFSFLNTEWVAASLFSDPNL